MPSSIPLVAPASRSLDLRRFEKAPMVVVMPVVVVMMVTSMVAMAMPPRTVIGPAVWLAFLFLFLVTRRSFDSGGCRRFSLHSDGDFPAWLPSRDGLGSGHHRLNEADCQDRNGYSARCKPAPNPEFRSGTWK